MVDADAKVIEDMAVTVAKAIEISVAALAALAQTHSSWQDIGVRAIYPKFEPSDVGTKQPTSWKNFMDMLSDR